MSLLLFLRGLVGVLVVFGVVTYLVTDSLWTTLIQTVICGVLIQIGYFAAVLFLVGRTGPDRGRKAAHGEDRAVPKATLAREEVPAGRRPGVPNVPRSGHS